jgi:hypothetical protein
VLDVPLVAFGDPVGARGSTTSVLDAKRFVLLGRPW